MPEDSPAERDQDVAEDDRHNGYEQELAQYESDLARYLQSRIKPGLSRSAIPLMARSIAREIARKEPPEPALNASGEDENAQPEAPDFEAEMHELQAELGENWILRFSVHGGDGWLTAEQEDASQRVEAPDAERLVRIVEAIDEGGGRQG
jgi:predicted secreted protein